MVEKHVLLVTPVGNVGSVDYLFVSSVKEVGVVFVVSPRLLLISVEFFKIPFDSTKWKMLTTQVIK